MSIEKQNESQNTHYQDPLNNPNLSVKEYFSSFIKKKSVEELIAYDNKLFSEIRNLESEKHILVTQNYKKFVAATETINTVNIKFLIINYSHLDKNISRWIRKRFILTTEQNRKHGSEFQHSKHKY